MRTAEEILKSLVSDITAMQERPQTFPKQFGEFEDYEISDHGLVTIEWPNLVISLKEAEDYLTAQKPPYWHDSNPWKDKLFYVTLEELADCHIALGKEFMLADGTILPRLTKDILLNHWRKIGNKLDPYVLIQPRYITGGIRYSNEEQDYLSPGFHAHMLWALAKKYGKGSP